MGDGLIRQATAQDIPQIVEMGRAFHAYSPHRDIPFDASATAAFVSGCLDVGAVFVTDTGMCGGTINPAYFNPTFKWAVEFFWWSPTKGEGRPLREAFEQWALANGADAVQFSALGDDRLPELAQQYALNGFQQAETAFIKRFT